MSVILGDVVDTAIAVTDAAFGSIQLVDPESAALRIVAQRGSRLKPGGRAVQSIPLVSRSGKQLGVFATHYTKERRPDKDKLRLLDLFARQAADIIEQAQAIVMLRQSEERFRYMADGIPSMIWVTDAAGNIQFVNKNYTEFFGTTLEELKSKGWHRLIHPDDVTAYSGEFANCLRDRRLFRAQTRVRRHDGEWRWIDSFGQPRISSTGEFLGTAGCSPDITDRKSLDEALRSVSEELRQTVRIAAVGLVHCNREFRYLSANPAYAQFVGLPLEQIVGRTLMEVIGEAGFELIRPQLERALRGEMAEYEIQVPIGGVPKWVRVAYTPDRDASGNVVGWVASIMDITDRKRLEEERAEEDRHKDEFLSLLGHELRNPLAAISTAMQLLSKGATDQERVSLHTMMDRQLRLMRRLLDDLLDLGRITHGHIQLKKERVDLAELLQHITAVTQPTVAEREQSMVLRLPSKVMRFMADEARLEQIVINLLNNASKYTPRGGRIELSGTMEGSEVVIRCKDSGRGIPRDMQQKIFEPFTRVEPLSEGPGEASLGIGLALVKRLVELHGGTISVVSSGPRMGSEFTVRLPLESPPSDERAAPESKPVARPRRARLVAVIEDNADVGEALVIALKRAGYQVTLFEDASSALSKLANLKPHAVLLDIGLPGIDGYELAAKLKTKPNLQRTLFIGMSGFKRRGTDAFSDGFDHFFNKPLDLPALLNLLDAPLSRRAKSPLRVLLIEDHALLAAVTAELLREEGHEVLTALSGRQALKVAPDFKPHLILCDMHLPDTDGREVIRVLRSNRVTRNTYAVVVSALSNHEIREFNRNPKRMGVDEFIPKPITRETVRTLLTKIKPEGEKVIQVSSPALGNHPRDERMSSVDSRRRHN